MSQDDAEDRELISRAGTFSVRLLLRQCWNREDRKLSAHEKVLRPVLEAATECWAYDIKPTSDVYRAATDILEREKGKYRVCLEGDPISGHELFWNAHGGKRGTIVILTPRRKFDAARIFRGGHGAFVFTNFRAGHTPAALRLARQRVQSADLVAVCLPRNNGIEWMDIHVKPQRALTLFDVAVDACGHWRPR